MDYFSGLRKAFDSIESEMTRSLKGNNTQEAPVEPHVIPVDNSSMNKVRAKMLQIDDHGNVKYLT